MSITKTSAVINEKGKMPNLYLKNVPVFYAKVYEPQPLLKKKPDHPADAQFSLVAFVDEKTKDYLIDTVGINKELREVGVAKKTKGKNRGSLVYPLTKEDGEELYAPVDGMYGLSLTRPNKSKAGKDAVINVVDAEGEPFDQLIGNGSVVNIKLFGYRNDEGSLVVFLDTVVVVKHVPYEGGNDGFDEELGITVKRKKTEGQKAVAEFDNALPEDDEDDDAF